MLKDFPLLSAVLAACARQRRYLHGVSLFLDKLEVRARNAAERDFRSPIAKIQDKRQFQHGSGEYTRWRIFVCFHASRDLGVFEISPSRYGAFTLDSIVARVHKQIWRGTIDYVVLVRQYFWREPNERSHKLESVEMEVIRPTRDVSLNRLFDLSR